VARRLCSEDQKQQGYPRITMKMNDLRNRTLKKDSRLALPEFPNFPALLQSLLSGMKPRAPQIHLLLPSLAFLAVSMVWIAGDAAARPKTDVVIMKNGDHITCEIKQLSQGKLQAKTDAMGTLSIEWDEIQHLESRFFYRVESRSGERVYGFLTMEEDTDELTVFRGAQKHTYHQNDVVEIMPIEETFWSRLDGSFSFGFSYTRASDVLQLTFDWDTVYRAERNRVNLKASSILTRTGADSSTQHRHDYSLGYTRLAFRRWTGTLSTAFQRNDELNLQRRIITSLTFGYTLLKSNLHYLLISTGAAWNDELATGSSEVTDTADLVFQTNYSLYKYDSPKTNLNTNLYVYPSLTEDDRIRVEFDLKLRRELVSDFFVDLSYFTSYDSNAPGDAGEQSDHGIVMSLGWSY